MITFDNSTSEGKERQCWQMDRLVDASIVDVNGLRTLPDTYKDVQKRVTIRDPDEGTYLDFGGNGKYTNPAAPAVVQGLSILSASFRAWMKKSGASEGVNGFQKITLERLNDTDWPARWKIKSEATERTYLCRSQLQGVGEVALAPKPEPSLDTNKPAFLWHIRSTSDPDLWR